MGALDAGTLGVWCTTDGMPAPDAAAFADRLVELGYTALWLPETIGRDPFAHIAFLAAHQPGLAFATGIANIHHRHPGAMVQAARALAEQTDRFTLGLGVSHAPFVERLRGTTYPKPLGAMAGYLDAMDASPYVGPGDPPPRVLAALGPKMLQLAADRTSGAHTYWATPAHTATARQILGDSKLLCVEQKVVLTEDADTARNTARAAMSIYDGLPNYRNHWLRLGFAPEAIDNRTDDFVDELVAWGTAEDIGVRIQAHRDAGADHVCIQPLSPANPFAADLEALDALAPTKVTS